MSKLNQYKYNEQEQLVIVFLIVLSIMISFFFIEINEKNLLMFLKILIIIISIAFQLKLDVITIHLSLIFIVLWFIFCQESSYEFHIAQVAYYCEFLPLHIMETLETGVRYPVELANCDNLNHLFFEKVRVQARMDSRSQVSFAKLCLEDTQWLDVYINMNVPIQYQADVKTILTRDCYCFHIVRELNRFINIYRPQL
jgi:hypothetical protein